MNVNNDDPVGYDADHFSRKQERLLKRKTDKPKSDGGKKMHRVGGKERWHRNPNVLEDDEEGFDDEY